MSTPAHNLREVFGRVEHGMAGGREAQQLMEAVEHLTWRPMQRNGESIEVCRHCAVVRTVGAHQNDCPAQEVA